MNWIALLILLIISILTPLAFWYGIVIPRLKEGANYNYNQPHYETDFPQDSQLENMEQNLTEVIADFLDSESVTLDEALNNINDPCKCPESELHIRMAQAAINEYKKAIKVMD